MRTVGSRVVVLIFFALVASAVLGTVCWGQTKNTPARADEIFRAFKQVASQTLPKKARDVFLDKDSDTGDTVVYINNCGSGTSYLNAEVGYSEDAVNDAVTSIELTNIFEEHGLIDIARPYIDEFEKLAVAQISEELVRRSSNATTQKYEKKRDAIRNRLVDALNKAIREDCTPFASKILRGVVQER